MPSLSEPADLDAVAVCRCRVLDLLRQGWTGKALAAAGRLDEDTVRRVARGGRASWRTCDVVADVFAALDGALPRYRVAAKRRDGARTRSATVMAQLQQLDRVRAGYRWGATVEALAEEYGLPVERVRLIVGHAPQPARRQQVAS